jgi:hypothetical protein
MSTNLPATTTNLFRADRVGDSGVLFAIDGVWRVPVILRDGGGMLVTIAAVDALAPKVGYQVAVGDLIKVDDVVYRIESETELVRIAGETEFIAL